MVIAIDIDVPADSRVMVFYSTPEQPGYSNERLRLGVIRAGNNKLTLPLPGNSNFGRLRLDPGTIEGEYTIRSVAVEVQVEVEL